MFLREKLVEKSSDKFDLLRDYEESGVVVDNGESRMEGEKKRREKRSILFLPFSQSQLNRDLTRLSFSIYIYVYVYIL